MRILFLAALLALTIGCRNGDADMKPTEPAEDQFFPLDGDLAASHILIAYVGAERAGENVTLTREQAKAKALELCERLAGEPHLFELLARNESNGPTAPRGGDLGSWKKGSMAPEFDTATESLAENEITTQPVETAFGFHVIRRNAQVLRHYGSYGFFITYEGSQGNPPSVTRTKAEAQEIAETITGKVNRRNFQEMAKKYNDIGDGAIFMGVVTEKDPLPMSMKKKFQVLAFNEVAGPIEFPVGYAFIQRIRLEQRAGTHVLIAHRDAKRADARITLSKEEARAKAVELIAVLKSGERKLEDVAREFSDGTSASHGGFLGNWFRGSMDPTFDAAVDGLKIGESTAQPVETPFGFHIIRRDPVE